MVGKVSPLVEALVDHPEGLEVSDLQAVVNIEPDDFHFLMRRVIDGGLLDVVRGEAGETLFQLRDRRQWEERAGRERRAAMLQEIGRG